MVEYIVTLKNFEDLESFYDDMETPGGTVYIPNRAVGLANRRPISRNTHYYLTESESELLRGDSRVLAVEQLPSARGIFPKPTWTQTANYEKSSTIDSNDKNWALYRCTEGAQTEGWATNGNTTVLNRTVNTTSSGRNVDVVIVDGHLNFNHPEFAVNSDGTGGSRAVQYNWWQWSANVGISTTGSDSYANITYGNHGTHTAGTVAGNSQGWARDATIYNIEFDDAHISGLPGSVTDFGLYVFDYIRQFHRNKPINPVTGKRNPTVVNNSWAYSYGDTINLSDIASVTYRGGTVSLSGDNAARKTTLESNGVPVPFNTYVTGVPARVAAVDSDAALAISEGIIMVASAGNSYWRCADIDVLDYYNSAVVGGFTYYHSQGSSPGAADTVICVGAISTFLGEYKTQFSNYGSRVDIYAPGDNIISSVYNSTGIEGYPTPVVDPRNSSYYLQTVDGTSMSGPEVTGCVACLAETWPSLTQAEARQYLETFGKYNQITSTGGGAGDYYSLGESGVDSNNLYLFYRLERKLSGDLQQNAYKLRPSSGVTYPRPRIKRYG
jgi:hypothetical protein